VLKLTVFDSLRNSDACYVRASAIDAVVRVGGAQTPFTQLVLEGSGYVLSVCEEAEEIVKLIGKK
jgi:hypothetical protein